MGDAVVEFLRGLTTGQKGWLVVALIAVVTWLFWKLMVADSRRPVVDELVLVPEVIPEKEPYRKYVTHEDVTEALLMIRDPRLDAKPEVVVNAYSIIESGAYIFASIMAGDYRIVGNNYVSDEVENGAADHAFCVTHGHLAFTEDSCLFPYYRAYHVGFTSRGRRLREHRAGCVLERVVVALPGTVAGYEPEIELSKQA